MYDLTLLRANDGANLPSAEGRLAFEVPGQTCEGFTVSFRMAAKSPPAGGRGGRAGWRGGRAGAGRGVAGPGRGERPVEAGRRAWATGGREREWADLPGHGVSVELAPGPEGLETKRGVMPRLQRTDLLRPLVSPFARLAPTSRGTMQPHVTTPAGSSAQEGQP